METFSIFFESNRTNKFNIHWQIVRTKARAIKDVHSKIDFVMDFLKTHANQYNYDRVLNWAKMTSVAYPENSPQRIAFNNTIQILFNLKNLMGSHSAYSLPVDDDNDLSKIPTEDLRLVLKDLKTRKYNFQYNQIPKDHTAFVAMLERELQNR